MKYGPISVLNYCVLQIYSVLDLKEYKLEDISCQFYVVRVLIMIEKLNDFENVDVGYHMMEFEILKCEIYSVKVQRSENIILKSHGDVNLKFKNCCLLQQRHWRKIEDILLF